MRRAPPTLEPLRGKARVLMVQGTSSHCGKSLLTAALCKVFSDEGYRVAPFKAQNMSLNSYVTLDGREIARAQAFQAWAAGVEPTADMNPILLKPKGSGESQVVFWGKPLMDIDARRYYEDFALPVGLRGVREALRRLMERFDVVVAEGAGSPAEVNLYRFDIANMRVAEMARAPVILVVDIERGGSFASLLGTLMLLEPRHRRLVKGVVVNKFRGDVEILQPGLRALERRTGKEFLGVIPFIEGLRLPAEDSMALREGGAGSTRGGVEIAVVRLPRISNFSDFDPLMAEHDVKVRFVASPGELGRPDLVILPGTKNTVHDLRWLRRSGLAAALLKLRRGGTPVMGICGGYQMLGTLIDDRKGIEGGEGKRYRGLGLLDVKTRFESYRKHTVRVQAETCAETGAFSGASQRFSGYRIHMGETWRGKGAKPLFRVVSSKRVEPEGAVSRDGLVFGTYIHGVFDEPPFRKALLDFLSARAKKTAAAGRSAAPSRRAQSVVELWAESLRRFVEAVKASLNLRRVHELVGLPYREV